MYFRFLTSDFGFDFVFKILDLAFLILYFVYQIKYKIPNARMGI